MPTRYLQLRTFVASLQPQAYLFRYSCRQVEVFISIGHWKKRLILKHGGPMQADSRGFVIHTTWRPIQRVQLTLRRSYDLSGLQIENQVQERFFAGLLSDHIH